MKKSTIIGLLAFGSTIDGGNTLVSTTFFSVPLYTYNTTNDFYVPLIEGDGAFKAYVKAI